MPTVTTNALNALLYINNGYESARWNYGNAIGTGVSLTYSFLSSLPGYASVNEVDFAPMNNAMKNAAVAVLDLISEVVDINFSPVSAQQGQVTFGTTFQDNSSAWAYSPYFYYNSNDVLTEDRLGGSVWVNNDIQWAASDWQPGAFGFEVLLHEMGHALGLNHSFEGDGEGGGFILKDSLDNTAHTIMSYTSAPRLTVLTDTGSGVALGGVSPSTLMPMDIEALQFLYGANMSTRSGNSVYQWDTNEEMLETLWDGGGRDTIDCSNQIFTCNIDLRAGQYSSIGLRVTDAEIREGFGIPAGFDLNHWGPAVRLDLYNGQDNVAIAKGVVIENATGGSGNDSILGNSVANRLLGGAGNDKLTGSGGNDILDGGTGLDRMNGGAGRDVFDFNKLGDLGKTLARADVISGFVSGVDRLDLSTLDADATVSGNQAFTFIGDADFSAPGQLRFFDGVLYGSTDADTSAEFMIKLAGVASLGAGDIVL